jgi:hypothetical protein
MQVLGHNTWHSYSVGLGWDTETFVNKRFGCRPSQRVIAQVYREEGAKVCIARRQ